MKKVPAEVGKVIAILPSYQAANTLKSFISSLPRHIFTEIILVDDCSPDGSYDIARAISGITVYKTPHNLGYGGNLKYCLSKGLSHGARAIVEIHPDGEYETDGIVPALSKIKNGAKLVLGNRFVSHPVASGMRPEKYMVSRALSFIENAVLGTHIPDLHQGFRVYTQELVSAVPFMKNSNDYSFSFEIIAQAEFFGFPIASVPVSVRYRGAKRGATSRASLLYTLATFRILCEYIFARLGLPTVRFGRK